jgi:D-sedoheptulose 7-phosphate isomerase
MPSFVEKYIIETHMILSKINKSDIEKMVILLSKIRNNKGRLFILGNGGSAGTASHSVNDFRKICGFESYTPTDNVSELTARINDEDPSDCFAEWLKGSNLNEFDAVLILSVGGGNT